MQTDAFIDFPVAYIFRKGEYDNAHAKSFAISRTSHMHIAYIRDKHPGANTVFYDDYNDCIDAVAKGKVDGMYINSFILSRFYDTYQDHKNLDIIYMPNDTSLSVGVSHSSIDLLTIFNKGISLIEESVKTSYLVHYSQTEQRYSVKKFLREKAPIIIMLICIISALIILAFWKQLKKVQLAQQHERESRLAVHEAFQSANKANAAKTEFLASMSHDIRTPMNAIIGMTAIAAANLSDDKKIKHCLAEITTSSKHLLGLINEVLDMNKIESGKLNLAESEFNIADLLDDFISLTKTMVKEKDHSVVVNIHDVKHENVIGDAERIQQCLMNFMSNAVKYTPDGGQIKFSINELPTKRPRIGCYEFVFEGNGIGMSEEFVRIMFDPFTRAEDERTQKQQGTGLGMSITKNIINMMNGNIKVESELDQGTKITAVIFLELQDIDEELKIAELADLPVLIADDDESACESTSFVINELGMKAEWVTSGKEAVQRIIERHKEANDFYAAIIDWRMPNMDGVETARQIRAAVGNDVPIIIISAYDWSDIEAEAREAGANAFIAKPVFKSKVAHTFLEFKNKNSAPEENNALIKYREKKFAGMRVLLAEDNELNAEIAKEILGMTGLEIDIAWNGKEAVEKMLASEDSHYKMIFMDIQMPVMDGYEATKNIRNSEREYLKNIPIVAMSANAFAEDVQKSLDVGMNEHISKPLDFENLLKVLNKYL